MHPLFHPSLTDHHIICIPAAEKNPHVRINASYGIIYLTAIHFRHNDIKDHQADTPALFAELL